MASPYNLETKDIGFIERTYSLLMWVAGCLNIVVMLIIVLDVSLKYFLNRPQSWVLETSSFSMLIITFLSSAWLLRKDKHIKVDILYNSLNPRTQAFLGIITSFFGVVISVVLTWSSAMVTIDYVLRGVRATTMTAPPLAIFTGVICLGFLTLLFEFLRRGIVHWHDWRTVSAVQQRAYVDPSI